MPVVKITLRSYLATLQETHDNVPTQKDLANLIGIAPKNFSRIVNNQNVYGFTRQQLALIIARLREIDPCCEVGDLLKFVE